MIEYCCASLKEMVEGWDGPFYWPISVDLQTGDLTARGVAVTLYNLTPSKKAVSAVGRVTVYLDFCPKCGTRLQK